MISCPRCGARADARQEYCLECGLRLRPGLADGPAGAGWVGRSLAALAVALAGGAAAVAASGGGGEPARLVTATGGFATAPTVTTLAAPGSGFARGIAEWPAGEEGWTVVLGWIPQTRGRRPAVELARAARRAGLAPAGILDSSRFASLHPGYWVVFAGIHGSEAEATSALDPARRVARAAAVRRIVP